VPPRRSASRGRRAGPERRVYRLTAKGTRQLRVDAEAIGQVVAALTRFMGEYDELLAGPDRDRTRRAQKVARARG
jgi:DNA-binding PadR family transcriptional regulator